MRKKFMHKCNDTSRTFSENGARIHVTLHVHVCLVIHSKYHVAWLHFVLSSTFHVSHRVKISTIDGFQDLEPLLQTTIWGARRLFDGFGDLFCYTPDPRRGVHRFCSIVLSDPTILRAGFVGHNFSYGLCFCASCLSAVARTFPHPIIAKPSSRIGTWDLVVGFTSQIIGDPLRDPVLFSWLSPDFVSDRSLPWGAHRLSLSFVYVWVPCLTRRTYQTAIGAATRVWYSGGGF